VRGIHVLREKLRIPRQRGLIKRRRLVELLRRSTTQFPATLISGRAGTGKSTIAAEFARNQDRVAWYSVESSDIDWNVFAHYFATAFSAPAKTRVSVQDVLPDEIHVSQSAIATFLINLFAEAETELVHAPFLIVLDDIHHLFDAEWFGEFFYASTFVAAGQHPRHLALSKQTAESAVAASVETAAQCHR
jgi:ATP/maltotriose-dependent transcriptional regulator MalT